ncbi:MAG: ABC transporter substrate-binding protein [Acidimicrobiales bacterium]
MGKRSLVVLAIVAALVLGGCGGSSNHAGGTKANKVTTSTEGKPVPGGDLAIGLGAETDGWNPTSDQWSGDSYYVAQTIFDPIAAYNSAGVVEPYLAKSLTHNANYTVWTIGLRSGIKFQNGQALNAAAVALQLNMCKSSLLVSQAVIPMRNAVVVNNLTVQVNMNTSWAAFPAVMAAQPGFIAAPAQLKAASPANSDDPIGTGPFSFVSWQQNSALVVKKNPNYWRTGEPYVNQITFDVIVEPTTSLDELESGEIQFMATAEASQIKSPPSGFDEQITYPQAPTFVMLNTAEAPLNNLDLRLALEYATNQQSILQSIDLGLGSVATEPYGPTSPWYVPSGYPTKPNLTKAKQYLDDYLAQTHTKLPVKFTLGCTNESTNQQAMLLLQAQWQAIGIDVNPTSTEEATFIDDAVVGGYQADCWAQFGEVDPDLDATWWWSANAHPVGSIALNFARLKDATTDHYLTLGEATTNMAQRKADYGQVWKQFAAQAPYIWLGRGPVALLWSPKVHGVGDGTLPNGQAAYPDVKAGVVTPIDQLWLSS